MISWLVSTTAVAITEYFSQRIDRSVSETRTANNSLTNAYFGGGVTESFTSHFSYSSLNIGVSITSANESAFFTTLSESLVINYSDATGDTYSYTFDESSANTVFFNSTSFGGNTSTSSSTTSSFLKFTYSVAKQTSTTQTTISDVFGSLESSSAPGTNAFVQTQSSAISLTTISQTSLSVTPEGATTSITTSAPTTTVAPIVTYWFFPLSEETITQTTTTTFDSETAAQEYATVYQADANEVIYSISSPTSFAPNPIAAREIASTFTRITVAPVVATLSRQSTTIVGVEDATSSGSFPTYASTTRTITQFGPDGDSSTVEWPVVLTTTSSSVVSLNYEFSTTDDATNLFVDPLSGAETIGNSTYSAYEANKYADAQWLADLFVWQSAFTSQNRFGKSGWDIGGQKGSEPTPSTLPFDVNEFSGSISRGRKTVFNITKSDLTIDAPSVTYRTTIGSDATTASTVLGVSGSMELIGDDAGNIEHLGGGGYAESWTVVDRVYPDYVYSDMVNSGTTSYLGDDTSYSGASRRSVSHLTVEPYLYGGGPDGTTTPDAIFWTEYRNPESEP
jgi:hypothetical protein